MFKIMIGLGLSIFLTNSAFAEVNYYPPLHPMEHDSHFDSELKPDSAVYMTQQEYQIMLNDDYIENEIFNMEKSDKQIKKDLSKKIPNYSINLGKDKKKNLLKLARDFFNNKINNKRKNNSISYTYNKGDHLYDILRVSYKEKYSKQCPIGYKNNGTMDKNICHETYDEYLAKLKQDNLNVKKNIIDHPTFWNDTEYDIPDSKYISNTVNDIFVYNASLVINFLNVCVKEDNINYIFKYKKMYQEGDYNFAGTDGIGVEFLKRKNGCIYLIRFNN